MAEHVLTEASLRKYGLDEENGIRAAITAMLENQSIAEECPVSLRLTQIILPESMGKMRENTPQRIFLGKETWLAVAKNGQTTYHADITPSFSQPGLRVATALLYLGRSRASGFWYAFPRVKQKSPGHFFVDVLRVQEDIA